MSIYIIARGLKILVMIFHFISKSMIPVQAIIAPLRGTQASIFISKTLMIYKMLAFKKSSVQDIKKIKSLLDEQFMIRNKLYFIIFNILSKIRYAQKHHKNSANAQYSQVFGINNEEIAAQKPLLLSQSLNVNISINYENTVYRAMMMMFVAQQKFYYNLAKMYANENQNDADYKIADYQYINKVSGYKYYDYQALYQLFTANNEQFQLYQITGLWDAINYFYKSLNDFQDKCNNITQNDKNEIKSDRKQLIEKWNNMHIPLFNQHYESILNILQSVQQQNQDINKALKKLDRKTIYDLQRLFEKAFFGETQIPQIVTAFGLQIFSTRECKMLKKNMQGAKRYEHFAYQRVNEPPSEGTIAHDNFIRHQNKKEANDKMSKNEQERQQYFNQPYYTVCCPACCIQDQYENQFVYQHNNVQHARSYLSGRILRFTERYSHDNKTDYGYGFLNTKNKGSIKSCGFITLAEFHHRYFLRNDSYNNDGFKVQKCFRQDEVNFQILKKKD